MQSSPDDARGALLRLATLILLAGCGDRLPTMATAGSAMRMLQSTERAQETVEPVDTLLIGDSLRLTLDTATATGTRARIDSVLWSSTDDYVASVDSAGLVRARAVGPATIVARGGGRYSEWRLYVLSPLPAGVPGTVRDVVSTGALVGGACRPSSGDRSSCRRAAT